MSMVRVTTAALISLLRGVPDFAEMFATYMVRQGMHDQENVVDHLTHSAEQRLARVAAQNAGRQSIGRRGLVAGKRIRGYQLETVRHRSIFNTPAASAVASGRPGLDSGRLARRRD